MMMMMMMMMMKRNKRTQIMSTILPEGPTCSLLDLEEQVNFMEHKMINYNNTMKKITEEGHIHHNTSTKFS